MVRGKRSRCPSARRGAVPVVGGSHVDGEHESRRYPRCATRALGTSDPSGTGSTPDRTQRSDGRGVSFTRARGSGSPGSAGRGGRGPSALLRWRGRGGGAHPVRRRRGPSRTAPGLARSREHLQASVQIDGRDEFGHGRQVHRLATIDRHPGVEHHDADVRADRDALRVPGLRRRHPNERSVLDRRCATPRPSVRRSGVVVVDDYEQSRPEDGVVSRAALVGAAFVLPGRNRHGG